MIRRSPISSDDGGGHRYDQGEARLTWPTSYPAPRGSRPISSAAASLRRAITTRAIPSPGVRSCAEAGHSCALEAARATWSGRGATSTWITPPPLPRLPRRRVAVMAREGTRQSVPIPVLWRRCIVH